MKPLLSISLTLATLLMCQGCDVSEENIPDAPDSGAYIDFAVAGEDDDSMTRAATTTLNINNFKVSAYAQDAYGTYHTLMDQVTVRRTGQNSWTYSPKVKWPGVPVDFFAVSPASVKVDNNAWSNHTINYSIGTGDRDLLVAVRMRAEQKSGPLKLNFRHALTRINISLQTDRRDVRIEVRNVTLHGAPDHGLFTFPTASTTPGTDPGEIFSQWETHSTTKSETDMTFFQSSAGLPHTLSDKQWEAYSAGKFMIPFDLTPFEAGTSLDGTYIAVACRYVDAASGETVWPDNSTPLLLRWHIDPGYGLAVFPLADTTPGSRWLPGRYYHYTLTLSDFPALP